MTELASYADFKKLELRAAQILHVEDVPGKDKLYKLTVDLGSEERIILAGIKPWYQKEELLGKMIAVVANLEPKKLAGMESQGMLLAAGDQDSATVSLLVLDRELPPGTIIQ